ncbi:hypothetical protein D3C86_1377000 [compost metagenome]
MGLVLEAQPGQAKRLEVGEAGHSGIAMCIDLNGTVNQAEGSQRIVGREEPDGRMRQVSSIHQG